MAGQGRRKKPSKLKLLNGTDRPDRDNPDEPDIPAFEKIPDPPDHLIEEAKKEWVSMGQELASYGCFTSVDKAVFAGYCQLYGRWVEAERAIGSAVVLESDSGRMYENPLLKIANKALFELRKFAIEFGMTPSARTKIKVTKGEQKSAFQKYLAGGKK